MSRRAVSARVASRSITTTTDDQVCRPASRMAVLAEGQGECTDVANDRELPVQFWEARWGRYQPYSLYVRRRKPWRADTFVRSSSCSWLLSL